MTIPKAIILVLGCMAACGAIGAGVGLAIGTYLPSAYRAMFAPVEPGFSPTEMGIALGLPQGLGLGAFVGVALVAILVWREVRLSERPIET